MPIEIAEIERKSSDFKSLFDRQDKDMDLYFGKKYEMLGFDDRPIPKIVNLTLNDPAVFAARSIAILQSAAPQTVIELLTPDDKFTHHVEEFSEDLYLTADENLGLRDLHGIYPFEVEQSCIRGRLAAQCLIRWDKKLGKVVIDIRPIDTRYFIYAMGYDGMKWGAYATIQSNDYLKEKYGEKGDIGDELNKVCWDIYDRQRHYFYIGEGTDALLVENTVHPFNGIVPIIHQKVPAGSMLAHPDAIPHDGESIFALNRDLYPELNRMATVLHNLTMASFFGARQYASEAGEQKRTEAIPFGLGVVVSVEKGGGYTLIPVNDIRNATRLEYSMLESRQQRGSLPNIDYGNLTFPLSAVAIGRLTESKDQIFVPRLQALAMFYQKLTRMAIKQIIAIGKPVELGEEGRRRTYNPSDLKGEYVVKHKYFTTSKEQKLANITEAQSLGGIVSDDYKRREILMLADPDGEVDKIRDETAEKIDPAIALYRRAHSLADKEKYVEAELTLRTLEIMLRQRMMQKALSLPEQPKQLAQGEEQPKSPMPLIEGGGGGGERREKGEEERMVEESEEEERIARLAETARRGRPTPALTGGE